MPSFTLLVNEIAAHLQANNWLLATAESCTGGLIAATLTEMPGSSNWFDRGFVTYSNNSKRELLGVSQELLDTYGAVGESVAIAMAEGALQRSRAHLAVSVTGIAGPDGGTPDKPVGLVCFAWAMREKPTHAVSAHFIGNRQEIRLASVHQALAGILKL